jgi:hypothetical protein
VLTLAMAVGTTTGERAPPRREEYQLGVTGQERGPST